jgi:choline dehydrogenase-like flavoprotein
VTGEACCDVLVVGSGPSAVNAAYPLVEARHTVHMLDVGNRDDVYERAIPDGPFSELRRTDEQQHRYLLGARFEGIGLDHIGSGAQLTPPRHYVLRDAERWLPIHSSSFFPLQSLAEGGLGAAWGAGSPPFSAADLDGFPISHAELRPHYEAVAARIGVSGARDDLLPFLGELDAMQPPLEIDSNGEALLRRYERRRGAANRAGLYLGKPRLAALSQPLRGRLATRYWDMEFWSDAGRSVYRPRWTVDELRAFPNFAFVPRRLVQRFEELASGHVVVTALDVDTGAAVEYRARRLVLAAGTLGTARIVLRSLGRYDRRVPLVCNPHSYLALFNGNSVGVEPRDARHSMAQLCVVYAPGGTARSPTVGHYYSYRSLLLFRLIKDSALPVREALDILRVLSPNFGVLIVQHEDRPSTAKHCSLVRAAGAEQDRLAIEYALSSAEQTAHDATEAGIVRALHRLRCVRLRTVRPGHAASTHFAGTFPMTTRDDELTTDPRGRLRPTRHVYLADGSVFPNLPSKGLTFTMMANADRIGSRLRAELGS